MARNKCISVSNDFCDLAEKNKISWSEAARVGMSMLLCDKGLVEYDNRLNKLRIKTITNLKDETDKRGEEN